MKWPNPRHYSRKSGKNEENIQKNAKAAGMQVAKL
jgi:hypothetical protein